MRQFIFAISLLGCSLLSLGQPFRVFEFTIKPFEKTSVLLDGKRRSYYFYRYPLTIQKEFMLKKRKADDVDVTCIFGSAIERLTRSLRLHAEEHNVVLLPYAKKAGPQNVFPGQYLSVENNHLTLRASGEEGTSFADFLNRVLEQQAGDDLPMVCTETDFIMENVKLDQECTGLNWCDSNSFITYDHSADLKKFNNAPFHTISVISPVESDRSLRIIMIKYNNEVNQALLNRSISGVRKITLPENYEPKPYYFWPTKSYVPFDVEEFFF